MLAIIFETPRWMRNAGCRGVSAFIFDYDDSSSAMVKTAKEYCRMCPVRIDCLQYAFDRHTETFGVWGGTTFNERKAIIRGGHRRTCPGCGELKIVIDDHLREICLACGLTWRLKKGAGSSQNDEQPDSLPDISDPDLLAAGASTAGYPS
jgi:hypothetical protein